MVKRLNKAIIFAVVSVFAFQYIAPSVAQTYDVLINDQEIRRIIKERCASVEPA